MTDADRDLLVVAMVAFDEASNQGTAGIRAVCHCIVNRHRAGRWYSRKTLAGTCFLSYQFSSLNDADPNRERGVETSVSDPIYFECLGEADAAINGTSIDPTGGATHYYVQGTTEPTWVSGNPSKGVPPATFLCQIGVELFYNNVQ